MVAIADACRELGTFDLTGCDIYTTGEPCPMCLCAIMWANIDNIYYGCTIEDAEAIGFRDTKFHKIMSICRKCVGATEIGRAECLELFERYKQCQKKKHY